MERSAIPRAEHNGKNARQGSAEQRQAPQSDPRLSHTRFNVRPLPEGDAKSLLIQRVPVAQFLSEKSGRVGRGAPPWFFSE